jgi:predicted patatin/cPLA2 family phospholipase
MEGCGLVLEGGGMKGVYTAGVLEYWLEQGLHFPYVIGVSAGACQAASYISKQQGRNKQVTLDYITDPRYLSYRNWLRERSMFGMDFIFNQIPNRLVPFDYEAFDRSNQQFVVATTDAHTGEAHYHTKHAGKEMIRVIQASSSLPFVSQPVMLNGLTLFDGGIADPIPVQRSIHDGNHRNVIILTKPEGYRKKPARLKGLTRLLYRHYPGIVKAILDRPHIYNHIMEQIEMRQNIDQIFVIRPSVNLNVSRMEKDQRRLLALYELGYADAKKRYQEMTHW